MNIMKTYLSHILIIIALTGMLFSTAVAQDDRSGSITDDRSRSITSDDFNSQRSDAGKTKSTNRLKKAAPRRAKYKYVTKQSGITRRPSKPSDQKSLSGQPAKVTEVGVTIWRLRPPRAADKGPKLPVQVNDSKVVMWTPERVGTDTVFTKGDRIRLAIESSVSGYLYIINSEIYSNGGFGRPMLIFPATVNEDNSVGPGQLVDVPDKNEELPYFFINPKGADYAGEHLTFIVSPKPLTNLKTDNEGYIRDLDYLAEFEEHSDVEVYSRTDTQDKAYTQEEAESACGAKARELTREKLAAKPCGTKSRELTRGEPLPQSIYRVKSATGRPAVAFISLSVKR